MMHKIFILCTILFSLTACNSKNSASTDSRTDAIEESSGPCAKYEQALSGIFSSKYMEGTMSWSGGISGTLEISGVDYNDMTCTYAVNDCIHGVINMNCNGGAYDTELIVYSADSIKLGPTAYFRVK